MNNPLVSVIIPTYNRKDMLKIAIDSVLKQDYKNIELIVSDNASTDDTNILMEEYLSKYHNINYVRREKNLGPFLNGREAYKVALGKYLIFLCDDDYFISSTFFTNAVKAMEENENIVLVRGIVQTYYSNEDKYVLSSHNSKKYIKGIDYFLNYYQKEEYDHITSTFAMMRKSALDKCGIYTNYDENLYETWIYLYLFLYGDVYFLTDEIIGCYNEHGLNKDSYDLSTLTDFDSLIKISKELITKGKELYPQYEKDIITSIENNIFAIIWFKLVGIDKNIGYDEAYKILKESKLIKEFPNLYPRFFNDSNKDVKDIKDFYFSIFSILKNREYIKINILGIKINIKLEKRIIFD